MAHTYIYMQTRITSDCQHTCVHMHVDSYTYIYLCMYKYIHIHTYRSNRPPPIWNGSHGPSRRPCRKFVTFICLESPKLCHVRASRIRGARDVGGTAALLTWIVAVFTSRGGCGVRRGAAAGSTPENLKIFAWTFFLKVLHICVCMSREPRNFCLDMYLYICTRIEYVCKYVFVYTYIQICILLRIHMFNCAFVYIYFYTYVYICV